MKETNYEQAVADTLQKSGRAKQLAKLGRIVGLEEGGPYYTRSKEWGNAGWWWLGNNSRYFLGGTFDEANNVLAQWNAREEQDQVQSLAIADPLPLSVLSPDKIDVYERIMKAVKMTDTVSLPPMERLFIIDAKAGTGKTTLGQRLAADASGMGYKTIGTALTNQAVKVLAKKIPVKCLTIHKFLGLTIEKKEGRTQLVMASPKRASEASKYRVVIIDEGSMMPEDVWNHVETFLINNNRTVLVILSDRKQVPPVSEEESVIFDYSERILRLTTTHRQSSGDPILNAANRVRRMKQFDYSQLKFAENEDKTKGFVKMRRLDWVSLMQEMFQSDAFRIDNNHCRALCWTNHNVDTLNDMIHKLLYGETKYRFAPGESVLLREPVGNGILTTNEECTVVDISAAVKHGIECEEIVLESENGVVQVVYSVHGREKHKLTKELEKLRKIKSWPDFYALEETFTDLQHIYAMTVHRCQGMTLTNSFVDMGDILKNRDDNEQCRLLYTAFTRATNYAYVVY